MRARLRERVRGRELNAAVVVAAGLGVLLMLVPGLDQPLLLLASAGLLVVAGALATWLVGQRGTVEWTTSAGTPTRVRGSDRRVTALTRTIDRAVAGDAVAQQELHQTVHSVARARLTHLGLPADLDDDGTRAALGPDLTAYLASSPPRRVGTDELASFITTLEEH
ncbi:hypothetical protein [Knoellia aerolata]|uniref:Uncharacterized protein n=1 Tax=Knoellia aerolata DSM 18566 TaxID=1385519 RepID=A0A0A0JSN5_9MICO|nr:hypothetical protein [Knoellia aerolata]KGN39714.1 hypothetical protein N801_19455 [Knoellia aerolata DSM 18566]